MRCDQCEALMINGVFCHETGCPNRDKVYDKLNREWRAVKQCPECGCTLWADDERGCCYSEASELDADEYDAEWSRLRGV